MKASSNKSDTCDLLPLVERMEGPVDTSLQREVPGNERPEYLLVAARPEHVIDLVHGAAQADRDLVGTRAAT
eukprot:9078863-Pyramimonas_sp.AAC.1